MALARTVLELRIGSVAAADLQVRRVGGREAVSEPFRFHAEFVPRSGEPLALGDLIGMEAELTLRRADGSERIVNGVADFIALLELRAGRPAYRVRIVPRLALLTHRRRCRIFQGKSVPDLTKQILDDARVKVRLALRGNYPPREFCVQYRESELDFLSRLWEEEGIFYFFEHADGTHTLVLADAPGAFADIAGDAAVPFRPPTAASEEPEEEHLEALARSDRVRAAKATLRDFDFERPALDLTASASAPVPGLESYDYGLRYAELDPLKRLSRVRLEELQVARETVDGRSTCLRFLPGTAFEATDHPDPAQDRKLQLLRLEHEATQQEAAGGAEAISHGYSNRFFAAPAGQPYRPLRRSPRPRVAGAQTATVVGPGGEEIHADEHGRIKVRFHWDREGPTDDTASCFVRVAQSWAGPGFGASYLPRIGQEVLVRFLDGDPDRPIVVGALYNGEHATPIGLPADKSQSTLRSESSPGGGGSNELRFEDRAGAEEIHLHAQEDQQIEVLRNKDQRVGANEGLLVGADRSQQVDGHQRLAVGKEDESRVEGSQSLQVSGNRTTEVGRSLAEKVGGSQSVNVSGLLNVQVGAASTVAVGAAAQWAVGGAMLLGIGGVMEQTAGAALVRTVAGRSSESAGASRSESVDGKATLRVGKDWETDVGAGVSLATEKDLSEEVGAKAGMEAKEQAGIAAKKFQLEAGEELSLVVGGRLLLQLKKSGDAKISASAFTASADGKLTIKGSQVKKLAGEAAAQKKVEVKQLAAIRRAKSVSKASMKSASGRPVAGVRFKAELPDGSVVEGVTDAQGNASIPSSKDGTIKVTLPDLDGDSWSTK